VAIHVSSRARVIRFMDDWREAAYDVEAAARRWRDADPDDREAAAAAFSAALEREEKAAAEYEFAWREESTRLRSPRVRSR
jgi:hypothetical protein